MTETDNPARDDMHICPTCGRALPVTMFYEVQVQSGRYRDGQRRKAQCKDCDKAAAAQRVAAGRARRSKPPPKPRGPRPATPPPGTLAATDVAERLGITRQRVHALGQQGRLTVVHAGRALFYTEESVQALERERAAAAARASQPKPPPKPRGPRPATPPPGTLAATDVAARLGITRQRVHALGQQGTLTAVREGRALFYTEESVQALERDRAQD